MQFPDKFHMTREQSIFLAKKKQDENVYCGMRMENRAVTFPQTKTILDGIHVPSVNLEDTQAILNMRDAWRFLLATFDEPITFDYWCKFNAFAARNEAPDWGHLRTGSAAISGTDYVPPVPALEKVDEELTDILAADVTATEKALMAFCWGARGQFFWDGNKRTSLLLANKILLQAGAGMLTIRDKNMERFNAELFHFYDSGDSNFLVQFMYKEAIQGIDFPERTGNGKGNSGDKGR